MHNRIFIEEDKEFTLDEFAHLVARAIRSIATLDVDKDEIVYSRDDVYFTIVDCLGYINERMPGRFKFDQTSFQHYLIHYVPPYVDEKKGMKGLLASKVSSALQIREITGKLPVWAENNEDIMEKIKSMPQAQEEPHV